MSDSATETVVWSETAGYDRYGNRRVTALEGIGTSPHNPAGFDAATNRITGLAYTARGEVKQDATGSRMVYDAEGKLIGHCKFEAACAGQPDWTPGAGWTRYLYDGEGRRVRKIFPAGGAVIYVYTATGQLAAEYGSDGPIVNGTTYLTADHLGSTRVVTDSNGEVISRSDYMPFGDSGLPGRGGITGYGVEPTRIKFTGKERDSETGLDYFLARYYSPAQGRFTSPDEITGGIVDSFTGQPVGALGPLPYADIADPQTINKYAYVRNNPLRYTDPDGHLAAEPCKTGQGHCTPSPSPGSQIAKGSGKILLGVGLVATAAVGDIPGGVAGVVILTSAVYGGTVTAVSGVNDIHGATAKKDVTRAENTLEAIGNFGGLAATAATGSEETGKTVTTLTDIATLAMKPKDATRNVATMGEATKTVVNAANLLMDSWGSIKSTVSGLFAPKSVQPPRPPAPAPPVRLR